MTLVRRIVFWLHLIAGVVAGSIVLIMSVTGVLLTYEKQIAAWADLRAYGQAPVAGAGRLAPEAIVAAVRAAHPDVVPTVLTLKSDPDAPALVAAGARIFFVNPYTGMLLGQGGGQPRAFFRRVTEWHRWLGVSGEGRATARMITGSCNLAFLFLIVSGFYLWFPRGWTRGQFRAVSWFRAGLRGKARDFNWHNTIGLWSAVPLFIVVLSGVVISYPWAGDLVYRAAGEAPPARAAGSASPRGNTSERLAVAAPTGTLNASWLRAEQQVDGWRTISVRIPAPGSDTVVYTIDRGTGGEPQKRATLTLDAATSAVVKWEPFSALSAGRRTRSYLRFGHTGEAAGLPGQTVAGLASLGGAVLAWTGLSLAVRRLLAWRARRACSEGVTIPVR